MKLKAIFLFLLLISPVFAFGVSPAIQTLKVNPTISTRQDITVRVYWNRDGMIKTRARIVPDSNETDWMFVMPEEFVLGPATVDESDREVVWAYAEVPEDAKEGTYRFRVYISTEPADEEGFLAIRQDVVSVLNLEVDHDYIPTRTGWNGPVAESEELSITMIAIATVLVLAAAFIFLKV